MGLGNNNRKHKSGFNPVEWGVLLAGAAMAAGLLVYAHYFPGTLIPLLKPAMVATVNNGRQIHWSIVSADRDQAFGTEAHANVFPTGGTSTAYFHWLITNRFMTVHYAFFSAKGLKIANNEKEFLSNGEHTAWCVVADSRDLPGHAPFLFTRNLDIQALNDPIKPDKHGIPDRLADRAPFHRQGFLLVRRDGSVYTLTGRNLKLNNFANLFDCRVTNQNGRIGTLTNRVLRPGPGL